MRINGSDDTEALLSDAAWERIAQLLPEIRHHSKRGRPRTNDRQAMNAILYRLERGCAWKDIPRQLGTPSTVYDRFRLWRDAGVFDAMWRNRMLGRKAYARVQISTPRAFAASTSEDTL